MRPPRIANTIPRRTGAPDLARRKPRSYTRQGRRSAFTRRSAQKLCDIRLPLPQLAVSFVGKSDRLLPPLLLLAAAAFVPNGNLIVCSLPLQDCGGRAMKKSRLRYIPRAIEAPARYAEVGERFVHSGAAVHGGRCCVFRSSGDRTWEFEVFCGISGNGTHGSHPRLRRFGYHCCVLQLQCPHFFLFPNLCSNRQLEPPLPLNFSYRIFRHSALAPNFSIDLTFRKGDMGSLVHSR